jgi:Zn-dependent protease
VHADALEALARDAQAAEDARDAASALALWRRALELLPPRARQSAVVAEQITRLRAEVEGREKQAPAGPPPGSPWARRLAPLGVAGVLLWKLKLVLVFALTKAKLLLLGLTKASTLFSMLLSFAVYWTAWGWRFAAGLLVSMYVHEMGHVAALQRLGIRATAPMFVPGLGAFVRLEQYPADAHEDARVGLAGPVWGLGAALVAFAAWRATGAAYWGAIAHAAAWLNLFNLLPVWQLDGSRGVRALSRPQRWLAVAGMAGAFWLTGEGLLVLLLLAAGWRAMGSEAGPGDRRALLELMGLVAVLSALCIIELPGLASP